MAFYYIPHSPGKNMAMSSKRRNIETFEAAAPGKLRAFPQLGQFCGHHRSSGGPGDGPIFRTPLFMEVKVYLTITIINWNNICSLILKHLPKW